jgi:glycosyltransferase involved in cell wall biosynthesis
MHILFLSHYFPPEVNAPASRTYENTREWINSGHKVTIITCAPNHPNGVLYPGYHNRLWQWDEKDGIRVLRVKTYLSANKGFLKRIMNYVSYMISVICFCFMVKNVDIVVSTSPQFFCGLAGYFVSRIKNKHWVLEIRDLWPESIVAVGAIKSGWIVNILESIETFMYRRADRIVALTEAFKRHINKRGVSEERITVIKNGADLSQFIVLPRNNAFRENFDFNGNFIASFVGTHGMAHGLETVFKAAEILRLRKDITFLLVGDGSERDRLLQLKEDMRLSNVIMLPQQKKEKMPEIIAASDACMVLLKKQDLFKTVIPSKMFEAMAMERPIIHGVEGESKAIIEEADCGICIEPENAQELADSIVRLYNDRNLANKLGKNGKNYVTQFYDRKNLSMVFLDLLTGLEKMFVE